MITFCLYIFALLGSLWGVHTATTSTLSTTGIMFTVVCLITATVTFIMQMRHSYGPKGRGRSFGNNYKLANSPMPKNNEVTRNQHITGINTYV